MAVSGRLTWISFGIICITCWFPTDQSMAEVTIFDSNGTNEEKVDSFGSANMTGNDTNAVDVDDFYVDMNRTANGTDSNGTLTNEITTRKPVSAECLWFKNNPLWRLSATTTMFRKFMCVCYYLCHTDQQLVEIKAEVRNMTAHQSVFERRGDPMFYFVFVLYVLVVILGTTGNIIVIVGIVGVMRDKTVVNRFVVSLAVADLFLSAFITPVKVLYHLDVMIDMTEDWFCKFILYMRQTAQAEAIVILTIIACERYYAICHPLKAKFRCSMKRANVLILLSWIVALIISLPTVFASQYLTERSSGALCVVHYVEPIGLQLHYLYLMIVLLVIPTFIMTFTYGRISFVMWVSSQKVAELTGHDGSTDSNSNKKPTPSDVAARKRVIVTMVVLLVVFLVCWAPRLVLNVVLVFSVKLDSFVRYYGDLISELLANSHSLLNPFMFIALSKQLKQALAKQCCSCLSRGKTVGSGSGLSSTVSGQTMASYANGIKSGTSHNSNHI